MIASLIKLKQLDNNELATFIVSTAGTGGGGSNFVNSGYFTGNNGDISIDWNQRYLYDSGPVVVLDWDNLILSGQWRVNIILTQDKILAASVNNLDSSVGTNLFQILTGSKVYSIPNLSDGCTLDFTTYVTGNYTVSFPTGVKWPGSIPFSGTSGSAAQGKYDLFSFKKINGLTFGSYSSSHY